MFLFVLRVSSSISPCRSGNWLGLVPLGRLREWRAVEAWTAFSKWKDCCFGSALFFEIKTYLSGDAPSNLRTTLWLRRLLGRLLAAFSLTLGPSKREHDKFLRPRNGPSGTLHKSRRIRGRDSWWVETWWRPLSRLVQTWENVEWKTFSWRVGKFHSVSRVLLFDQRLRLLCYVGLSGGWRALSSGGSPLRQVLWVNYGKCINLCDKGLRSSASTGFCQLPCGKVFLSSRALSRWFPEWTHRIPMSLTPMTCHGLRCGSGSALVALFRWCYWVWLSNLWTLHLTPIRKYMLGLSMSFSSWKSAGQLNSSVLRVQASRHSRRAIPLRVGRSRREVGKTLSGGCGKGLDRREYCAGTLLQWIAKHFWRSLQAWWGSWQQSSLSRVHPLLQEVTWRFQQHLFCKSFEDKFLLLKVLQEFCHEFWPWQAWAPRLTQVPNRWQNIVLQSHS